MQIHGPTQIHGPQSINAPHRTSPSQQTGGTGMATDVDTLEISPEANILSSMNNVPEIRASRVADIRAQIESGVYETEDKLDAALERLLDEIG